MAGTGSDDSSPGGRGALGTVILGGALVLAGLVLLIGRVVDVDVGDFAWPFFVILPGIVLFAFGLSARGGGGRGMVVAGSIVTATGLLLLYQNAADHFESWAYAWALVSMVAPGLGQIVYGKVHGDPDAVGTGTRMALTGAAFFVVGLVFFELVIGIGGGPRPLRGVALPILLIAGGIWVVVGGYIARRQRG